MFDINEITLEEIDAEYARTLDKLERLSKLREAVAAQDRRRIKRLVAEYNIAQYNARMEAEAKKTKKEVP